MKDTDGSIKRTKATASTALVVPSTPSRTVASIDALRGSAPTHATLLAAVATSWWSWSMWSTTLAAGGGIATFGLFCLGIVSAAFAACMLCVVVWKQIVTEGSLLQKGTARLAGRRSIPTRAADSLADGWDRAEIVVKTAQDAGYGSEPRMMDIGLPGGAHVHVLHRREGRTLVVLEAKSMGYFAFDPDAALGMVATTRIMATITRIQADRLSLLLGIDPDQSTHALARALATILPCDSDDVQRDVGRKSALTFEHIPDLHLIETRNLKGVAIRVVSIRPKHGDSHSEIFVQAPGVGTLSLPTAAFSRIMAHRRRSALNVAFGGDAATMVALPVFVGNARASRIAALARQALQEDPALTDATGSPIRSLIEEHMPRLIAVHRDSTRTAQTSDIAEIDAVLDRGLDVVARALGDAIEGLNDRKLDALRTEVRFLETRHPDHAASPLAPSAA